jgi:hypothetical protein
MNIQAEMSFGDKVKQIAFNIGQSLLTWSWAKRLLYWLIISAGTMSELTFLIASLWISLNSSVHQFVLKFMNTDINTNITSLATAGYVALPELILGLACVTTIGHVKMFLYSLKHEPGQKPKPNYIALIWAVLYGLPTLVFLVLSVFTLGSAVSSNSFELPTPLAVTRAIAGYMFAFTSLLYWKLGDPQEAERLAAKDSTIVSLQEEKDRSIETLTKEKDELQTKLISEKNDLLAKVNSEKDAAISHLQQENAHLKTLLAQIENAHTKLVNDVNKSSEDALGAYSDECKNWLNSGAKSVSIEEIIKFTGHSKRKINNAMTAGKLLSPGRNKELILVSSLMEWLKQTPPYEKEAEPRLHILAAN